MSESFTYTIPPEYTDEEKVEITAREAAQGRGIYQFGRGWHTTFENKDALIAKITAERDKLAAFKAYVHKRLDDAGVPVDPESSHKAEGCRIGGRLDLVFAERDTLREQLERIKTGEKPPAIHDLRVEYRESDNRFYVYKTDGTFCWSGGAVFNAWQCVTLCLDRAKAWDEQKQLRERVAGLEAALATERETTAALYRSQAHLAAYAAEPTYENWQTLTMSGRDIEVRDAIQRLTRVLGSARITLMACWKDLSQWRQFAAYNASGILCGEKVELPDPPQRPNEAGVNYTEQTIVTIEETLQRIKAALTPNTETI